MDFLIFRKGLMLIFCIVLWNIERNFFDIFDIILFVILSVLNLFFKILYLFKFYDLKFKM